ncbi:quinone oxidoreductase family protein [Acetobacter orleanensis]|uniref:Quinone oxidoreductase n=1 Tax=Acetobacter orleanensis TaxID=104099 RepID=A0A4Y3TQ61_9PROT|nr:quinone oxidoreductase [Acetobacter orleanensis]KXV62709.1 quinone oxidoreductase [Acetobacter orleanensis]PCD79227.1 quinone oxidoreductase [Acetobacter orleanensis]GAN68576.1 alcohol dehydrogenase [Acetobacter orleanensis JCM 7639]GBR27610.1 zinc-dependent alcohol dehydrogenase [Acetobacter orleanensis NRIC 0473]GEB83207.1 quinone oxidoreductase [Acetobacter orleanensis]
MSDETNTVIRVHDTGGPGVLSVESQPVPKPGAGEILLRQEAIGVNFIDTYFRSGLYKFPSLPAIPGMEGAGVVVAVGPGVTDLSPGMRVAYAGVAGAYAQYRTIAAERVVVLPDSVSSQTAAAVMLRGLSAHMLLRQVYPVRQGETILVYAAAGGVGQLLCQWGRHLGARVIGVTSTKEKAELARACGASDVVIGTDNLVQSVRDLTGGAMLPVVYDSIGRDTFEISLSCLAPRGLMVSYGNASGPVTGLDVGTLGTHGSLYLTRPALTTYIAERSDLLASAAELFRLLEAGVLQPSIGQRFALTEATQAHRALESRKTTGSTILLP